jgi:hypothetical protein
MVPNNTHQLESAELLPNRPFTHPVNTEADHADLEHIRTLLREALQQTPPPTPYEISGERHRFIILNHAALLTTQPITVVGFCASKRGNLSPALLDEMNVVDGDLMRELAQHPDMLTYSSIQLQDGNWKNLVLLRSNAGIGHWRNSQRHGYAADKLSPQYYAHVRLHNGVLPQGLASAHIVLTSTKYYDFDCEPAWRAVRVLEV